MIVLYPLNFNEIPCPNFVLENRATPVTGGRAGRLYFNSATRFVECWSGLRTLVLGAPSDAGALPGTLALRDASGGLVATAFSGPLSGNADTASLSANSLLLNGQPDSFFRARINHTGTQLSSTISDLNANIQATRLDQFAPPIASLNLNHRRITNTGDPVNDTDTATKRYVDNYLAFNASLYLPFSVYDPAASGKVQYSVNADLLAGAGAGYYLERGHHSGVQLSATISDFLPRVQTVRLNELASPNANLSLGGFKLVMLGDPQADSEAATKRYVDSAISTTYIAPKWNSIEGIPPLRKTFAPLPFRYDVAAEQTEACGYGQYFFYSSGNWRQVLSSGLRAWAAVPASSTAWGEVGLSAYDANYFYLCVGPSSWRRITLASWSGDFPFNAFAPVPEGHTYCNWDHFFIAIGTNTWMRFPVETFSGVTSAPPIPAQSYYPGLPGFETLDAANSYWYYCWEANNWRRAALETF